jgi:hypothetical protein
MNLKDFAADLSQLLYYLKDADIPEKYWPAAIQAASTEAAGEQIGLQIRNALNDHAAYVGEVQIKADLGDLSASVEAVADAICNMRGNALRPIPDNAHYEYAPTVRVPVPSAGADLSDILG